MSIDPKKFGLSDSLVNAVNEALKGDQHKIDANKNGKIDANDFKKLRGEETPGKGEKHNYKHDMMKSEVADGNKANFKQNMKEGAEQIDEKVKTTHENPLVTVHDKDGLHTHANLSTANKIFNTKVKHTDVHAGPVKTKDGHETKNNLTFAISKHHASAMKEEVEQIDELSKKTLGSYVTKASDKAATHTGAAAHYGSGGTGNNPAKMAVHQAIATKRKMGIQKAVDKLTKEEVEQIDELSSTTLQSYRTKALAHKSKVSPDNPYSSPEHKAAIRQDRNRSQGKQLSWKKMIHQGAKVPASKPKPTTEEVVDEAATKLVAKPQYDKARPAFGANVAADMDARKTEVQRRIATKQASMQLAKSNKRISGSPVKESKCSCGEAKESKMTCEVHGDNKGLKGGKEPIIMNPPLKEASDLPKAVVTKGHEIAKSLIKHRSKVKEPYAVGMAAAKKSAGIKD
jgi:hypothetical protein